MAKHFYALLTFINVTFFAGCVYFVASRGFVPGAGWSGVEVVTIVLAALAVLMTVLGIFIAVLAVWGYARLSEEARKTAALEAQSFVGKNAPRLISEELDRRIGSGDYGEAAGKDKASDAPSNG
jgi:hypothetical protein